LIGVKIVAFAGEVPERKDEKNREQRAD